MEIPSKKVYLSRNIIKENDSIFIKYTDEYGRSWKETISKIYPEFQMLLWGGGDNNLSFNLNEDIEEVREGIKNSSSNMVVNVVADFANDPDTIYNIYSINGNYYETQESPLDYDFEEDKSYDNEINSGDINTLENYLFEIMSKSIDTIKYLNIWNHGDGWLGEQNYDTQYLKKNISIDDGNNFSSLTIKEIAKLLNNFYSKFDNKIDIFGTDSCYMAFVEVIYEFADDIDYYIGSVDLEPGDGWDYTFLKEFDGNLENLLKYQIDSYFEYYNDNYLFITLSAIKTDGLKTYISNNLKNISDLKEKKEDNITGIDYIYTWKNYYGTKTKMLDLGILLPDNFHDNFIIYNKQYNENEKLEREIVLNDTQLVKYNYFIDKLTSIGISYEVPSNIMYDYMELDFYNDFPNFLNY
jgi:hypothetical protein